MYNIVSPQLINKMSLEDEILISIRGINLVSVGRLIIKKDLN